MVMATSKKLQQSNSWEPTRTKDTSHGDGHKQGAAAVQRLRASENKGKGRSEEPRLALSEGGERIELVLPIARCTPVERLRWSTCFGIDKRLITISVSHIKKKKMRGF